MQRNVGYDDSTCSVMHEEDWAQALGDMASAAVEYGTPLSKPLVPGLIGLFWVYLRVINIASRFRPSLC